MSDENAPKNGGGEMSDREKYTFDRIDRAFDRSNSNYEKFNQLSAQFAILALRSAFVLNGAALFALTPVFLALAAPGAINTAKELYVPSSWFVAGIAAAALSSLFCSMNYQRIAIGAFDSARYESASHQAQHNPKQYLSRKSFYDEKSVEAKDDMATTSNWAKWTAWIALTFAIASFVSFVIGCYWAGEALLPTSTA